MFPLYLYQCMDRRWNIIVVFCDKDSKSGRGVVWQFISSPWWYGTISDWTLARTFTCYSPNCTILTTSFFTIVFHVMFILRLITRICPTVTSTQIKRHKRFSMVLVSSQRQREISFERMYLLLLMEAIALSIHVTRDSCYVSTYYHPVWKGGYVEIHWK